MRSVEELEDRLSTPSPALIADLAGTRGADGAGRLANALPRSL